MSTEVTENAVIRELADEAAARELIQLDPTHVAFVRRDDQTVEEIDLEPWLAAPLRKTGRVFLTEQESLVEYVNRHKSPTATTLWGNETAGVIVAVLDDHATDVPGAGWGQHRAELQLKSTEDWRHWLSRDGQLVDQATFAEHIEDGVDAIRTPAAAQMLEIAQTFHAKNNVTFASSHRLDSGEVQLQYQEDVQASAGRAGSIDIPQQFTLGLAPFEGTDPYEVVARFRHRLVDKRLRLGYKLIRPDKVHKAAFGDVLTAVSDGVGLPVMAGVPRL